MEGSRTDGKRPEKLERGEGNTAPMEETNIAGRAEEVETRYAVAKDDGEDEG